MSNSVRTLRVAVVQMESRDHDVIGNLTRASSFAEAAARDEAELLLFPELMPTGNLSYDVWKSAEPSHGPTALWLARTANRLGAWIGTSFLEAEGDDFYNTFVLAAADGTEAGRVRKQALSDVEGYFFKASEGSHVIETTMGRIGVGICAENCYSFIAREMQERSADLILMPHSSPDLSESGGLPSPPGTHLSSGTLDISESPSPS